MPVFKCSECGCLDNTALGNYWIRKYKYGLSPRCSECDTGTWHGEFKKQTPESLGMLKHTDGFYWTPEEIKILEK